MKAVLVDKGHALRETVLERETDVTSSSPNPSHEAYCVTIIGTKGHFQDDQAVPKNSMDLYSVLHIFISLRKTSVSVVRRRKAQGHLSPAALTR